MSRATIVDQVARLSNGLVTVIERRGGWPDIVRIGLSEPIALHLAPVGQSHRGRDGERRMQNPGSNRPVVSPGGFTPLLIGLWSEQGPAVLVAFDASARIGLQTRHSMFVPLWLLQRAAEVGWAEHVSNSQERIIAFIPALLGCYAEHVIRGDPSPVISSLGGGHASDLQVDLEPQERLRRFSSSIVRAARFGAQVNGAYEGLCAMCDLDLGLCQGAHIFPACVPGAPDELSNAIALCGNHHSAFDRHLVWVDPSSRQVRLHPTVVSQSDSNAGARFFRASTRPILREPLHAGLRPSAQMFHLRYGYYEGLYDWAV